MAYHQFFDQIERTTFGSFEVFHTDDYGAACELEPGWYWWPCFPGCLPDTDEPTGPFETEQAAIDDANGL